MMNGLSIPGNENNLIPPCIMSETGLEVNPRLKIQCKHPTVEDHSIYDEGSELRILLQLNGIFPTFTTRGLTCDEMSRPDDFQMIILSPDSPVWNQYDKSYALNKATNLDQNLGMVSTIPTCMTCLKRLIFQL